MTNITSSMTDCSNMPEQGRYETGPSTTGASQIATERRHPRVLVSHSGRQYVYDHATSVQRAGFLGRLVTSGYYKRDRSPDRWFSHYPWLDSRLRRRYCDAIDSDRVTRRWRFELPELIVRGIIGNGVLAERLVFLRDARFDHWLAKHWAGAYDILWGFQGSCLESLRAARAAGKIAVAEFSTAHVTLAVEILSAEAEKHPDWADSISNFRFPDWYRQRLEQEPHEADYCIVASQFTKQSLVAANVNADRIRLLPLGVDLTEFAPVERSEDGIFRILFVGGVGQRKGVKYLLEAYSRMRSKNTELVIAGPLVGSGRGLHRYDGSFTFLGRLDGAEVVRQMRRSHVFVLPSVFEGFGLVIPEAMATGMPVIASTHSIGPEIIRDGVDGFILEPDDVDGLAARLDWLASHRNDACEMGRNAAVQAGIVSWERHQARVAELIEEMAVRLPANN